VDLSESPELAAFRTTVRTTLADLRTWEGRAPAFGEDLTAEVAFLRGWQKGLAHRGLVGLTWPVEYGGGGTGPVEHAIVTEELARAGAPELLGRIGVNLVGPTLLHHGTEEQKSRWLPRILDASEVWCQLFSEPDAGSDLASLSTRATRTDGGWLVSGQKVWTSYAQVADWGLCLVRSDPAAAKHKGITMLVVDMRAGGVTVRPLRQSTGESEFNEVFLDEVFVPDERVIGDPGHGWRIANSLLSHERGTAPRQLVIHTQLVSDLVGEAVASPQWDRALVRQGVAQSYIELRLFQLHSLRSLSALAAGAEPGPQGSSLKLYWSEASKRMHAVAMEVLGEQAPLWGRWQRSWTYYQASSIWAGTNEIQRNILGERVLGLPREPRETEVRT
jgi:alkylation response protein AidB-like acyl-CoA dehydrogenase